MLSVLPLQVRYEPRQREGRVCEHRDEHGNLYVACCSPQARIPRDRYNGSVVRHSDTWALSASRGSWAELGLHIAIITAPNRVRVGGSGESQCGEGKQDKGRGVSDHY